MKISSDTIPMKTNVRLHFSVASAQGGRKYMEDEFSIVQFEPSFSNRRDSVLQKSFLFFGIFDGHGGNMASKFTKQNLCKNIVRYRDFWSDDDNLVCLAIHKGFVRTQQEMMNEVANWPKTNLGFPSTSGTTASVLFIMNGKYYTGHVGDSRIVLGRNNMFGRWISYPMTRDHKPETPKEKKRIEAAGGKVMVKSGIGRVVWKRPRANCDLVYDFIPFLAVARSLGDLWSLNKQQNTFVVSPEPDVHCLPLNPKDRCLILASDGLWNMISCKEAISLTREFEKSKSADLLDNNLKKSPSMHLLEHCLDLWSKSRCRADNTTVLSLIFETEHIEYDFDEFHSIYDFNDYLNFTFIGDTIHSLNNTIDDDLDDIKHECENDENVKTIDNEVEYLLNDMLNQVCLNDVDHNKSSLFDAVSDENELTSDQLALIDFDSFNDTATIGDDRVNTNGCFIIKKPEINENSRLISNQQIHAPLSKMTFQQNHTYNGNESYSSTITAPTSNVFNYQHGFNIFNNCDNSFDDNSSTYTTPVTFSYEQTSSNSTTPDSYNTSDNQDAPTQFSTNQFYSESIDTNRTFFNAPLSITPTTTFSNDTTASFVNFLPKFNLKRCYDSDNASTENDFKRFCTNIDTNGSPDSFDTANNSFIQSTAGQCVKQYLSTNNGTTRHSMDIHAMATINE